MLMRAHDGCVDHRVFVVRIIGQSFEKTLPNAFFRPARKPRVDVLPAPNRSGRSRHGAPERNFQITASTNRRLPTSLLRPTLRDAPEAELQSAQIGRHSEHTVASKASKN